MNPLKIFVQHSPEASEIHFLTVSNSLSDRQQSTIPRQQFTVPRQQFTVPRQQFAW
jgi:hypothetical protein